MWRWTRTIIFPARSGARSKVVDKNRGQFQNGTRYLLGKPMTVEC